MLERGQVSFKDDNNCQMDFLDFCCEFSKWHKFRVNLVFDTFATICSLLTIELVERYHIKNVKKVKKFSKTKITKTNVSDKVKFEK